MKKLIVFILMISTAPTLFAQVNLEVEGKAKIMVRDTIETPENIAVFDTDGTLAEGSISDMIIKYFISLPTGIQTLLDSGESPAKILEKGALQEDFYGVRYQGGYIFDISPTGLTISICAESDIINNYSSLVGAAATNFEVEKYKDWVLPTKDELNLMWERLHRNDCPLDDSPCESQIGDFQTWNFNSVFYWSRSFFTTDLVWIQDFLTGDQSPIEATTNGAYARPVRYINHLQAELDNGVTPIELLNLGVKPESFYGLTYAGGLIYYMTPAGTGYVCQDQPAGYSFPPSWGCTFSNIPGAENSAIGGGAQNTIDVLASLGVSCNSAPAVAYCANLVYNGYSDWFLPSRDALTQIHRTLADPDTNGSLNDDYDIGDFYSNITSNQWYWSSTEFDASSAYYRKFDSLNEELTTSKSDSREVRAVRAF